MDRTLETRPHEDHMEFWFAFRQECVTLSLERSIHVIKGPADMSPFCRHQMAMSSASWCLYCKKRHECDDFSNGKQSSFNISLVGLLRKKRMNSKRNVVHSMLDIISNKKSSKSNYFGTSKALSGKLRHCKKRYLLNACGTMSLGNAFAELDWQNPIRLRMSPSDFAALLLANDKKRFKI